MASVPDAPLMPSLTLVGTPTSLRLGGAFGGAHKAMLDRMTASGRFPRERLKISREMETAKLLPEGLLIFGKLQGTLGLSSLLSGVAAEIVDTTRS